MKSTFAKFILFISFLVLRNLAFGQEVNLNAVLDTSRIRIGEQVKLDIYLQLNSRQSKFEVQWPSIGDTLTSDVEVISVSRIDTTIPDKSKPNLFLQHQQLIVSVYDSGLYMIPGFKFIVDKDTTKPRFTNPLFLEVHTVPTDSSAAKIKDIKPPFLEPFNWKWYLNEIGWTVAVLFLIGCAILVWYFRSLKNKTEEAEPSKPKIPAHIKALESLGNIMEQQIWKDGKVKEYYSEISDTLRLYIEDRYGLPALESTTDEIMQAFRSQVIDPASKEKLKQILTLSDLVKFAKLSPIEAEHELSLKNAFDFVNGTKREEVVEEAETNNEIQNQA